MAHDTKGCGMMTKSTAKATRIGHQEQSTRGAGSKEKDMATVSSTVLMDTFILGTGYRIRKRAMVS